jgi:hypothetical protein
MNRKDFNEIVKKRQELIERVLVNKGAEYANEQNVFYNFEKAVGISFSNSREMVAWEYMTKHLQSIKDLIDADSKQGPKQYPAIPTVEEKIGDAINYLILIEAMLKQKLLKRESL